MVKMIKRPVLRYHGGKWRLAPWIIDHFPNHQIYVEPFGGAASVLMRKARSRLEVINDLNDRIVSAFRVLRNPEEAMRLAKLLTLTPYANSEYVACRERSTDPVEDARRLIVLAYQGHGSTGASGGKLTGWRRGDRGSQSTSARDWASLPDHVTAWSERLRDVFIESTEALKVIRRYDGPETLFYVDPPYLPSTRCRGLKGYAHEMTTKEHQELAETLHKVEGYVVLSGYASDLYTHLYPDWRRVEQNVVADKAKSTTEVLWLSPRIYHTELPLFR